MMCLAFGVLVLLFFFKQKTAYEMRMSDWSSDVCSSDLDRPAAFHVRHPRRLSADAAAKCQTQPSTRSTLKEKTMKPLTLAAMLGLAALLAACGQKAETDDAAANTTAEATAQMDAMASNLSGDMGHMELPMAGPAEMAKGAGKVEAVDKSAGANPHEHG